MAQASQIHLCEYERLVKHRVILRNGTTYRVHKEMETPEKNRLILFLIFVVRAIN